jgi:hypothetical protein
MRPLREAAARFEDEGARELVERIDQFAASR